MLACADRGAAMNNLERRTFLEAAIFPLIGLGQSLAPLGSDRPVPVEHGRGPLQPAARHGRREPHYLQSLMSGYKGRCSSWSRSACGKADRHAISIIVKRNGFM